MALCLLTEASGWDAGRADFRFAGEGGRWRIRWEPGRSRARRSFQVAKDPSCTSCLGVEGQGFSSERLAERSALVVRWQERGAFFYVSAALGKTVTLQVEAQPDGTLVLSCARENGSAPPRAVAWTEGLSQRASARCCEALVLVCDANSWMPNPSFHFQLAGSFDGGKSARHVCWLHLGKETDTGLPVSWQFAFVPLSFQILSAKQLWSWRVVPRATDGGWTSGNILTSTSGAVPCEVATSNGSELHGRDFRMVEPHGTYVVLICDLSDSGSEVVARVWYQTGADSAKPLLVSDKRPAVREEVLAALQLRGEPGAWDEVLARRCPAWWRRWAQAEREGGCRMPRPKEWTREEVLGGLQKLQAALKGHSAVLASCRRESTVKLCLEDFPYWPPRAMQVVGTAVEQVVAKHGDLHQFWSACCRFLDADLHQALASLQRLLEGEAAKRSDKQLAVRQGGEMVSACGTKLQVGMRVMLRWRPGSVGATHMAYLNGHVGVLNAYAGSRWQLGFETFDGHIDVGAEHLQVVDSKEPPRHREELSCEMCLGHFLEMQVMSLPCPSTHTYCHDCVRKWVLTQLVPRCYKCLDELSVIALPRGVSDPWCGVVMDDAGAAGAYRITKADIEKLDCMCCFQIVCGARCVIIGHPGLLGQRCVVGRVEKSRIQSFAVVYVKNRRYELDLGCLAIDDCLSSGRLSAGEVCPSKGERLGMGLSVASLGCACVVKQAMDEMFVEQLAMPFDWLVSRVEGLLYFFRHGFRDFLHYDDSQVVGEHGYTSFRSAYHAFPHHDMSCLKSQDAFARRCERLLELVRSSAEPQARPLLLVRVCARSEELDQSEELYHLLRLMGGQKLFLLVIITEQPQHLGAVQHVKYSNLIFYVCQPGGADLVDAVRFGMDYVYAAVRAQPGQCEASGARGVAGALGQHVAPADAPAQALAEPRPAGAVAHLGRGGLLRKRPGPVLPRALPSERLRGVALLQAGRAEWRLGPRGPAEVGPQRLGPPRGDAALQGRPAVHFCRGRGATAAGFGGPRLPGPQRAPCRVSVRYGSTAAGEGGVAAWGGPGSAGAGAGALAAPSLRASGAGHGARALAPERWPRRSPLRRQRRGALRKPHGAGCGGAGARGRGGAEAAAGPCGTAGGGAAAAAAEVAAGVAPGQAPGQEPRAAGAGQSDFLLHPEAPGCFSWP
ncbi:unnamed protein product [Effrenium voratum]|nr:unnamed protein product [Effrenium voratum]